MSRLLHVSRARAATTPCGLELGRDSSDKGKGGVVKFPRIVSINEWQKAGRRR
jgi:hypothetical protein